MRIHDRLHPWHPPNVAILALRGQRSALAFYYHFSMTTIRNRFSESTCTSSLFAPLSLSLSFSFPFSLFPYRSSISMTYRTTVLESLSFSLFSSEFITCTRL